MLRSLLGLFLFAFVAVGLIKAQEPIDIRSSDYRIALEKETFFLVNQYRLNNHLSMLQWDNAITKVARGHSRDMAGGDVDFGHDGFGRRVKDLKMELDGLCGAGENVLKTDNPNEVARTAVNLWLRSPHHLENIRGDFNYSGLGVWVDDHGVIYFTQFFVKLKPKTEAAQEAPPPQLVTPFGFLATPKTRTDP